MDFGRLLSIRKDVDSAGNGHSRPEMPGQG